MVFPIVLVRFGEIGLKSRNTRVALRRLLRHNVLATLKVNGLSLERIEDTWDRLIVYSIQSDKVAQVLSKVFGVVSTSPAIECRGELDDIVKTVSDVARESLREGDRFAIRVRRVGKHEFTTHQIASACGSSVIQTAREAGIHVTVNLESPDREFLVEVRDKRGFVYGSIVRGVGGLPIGSQGKVVSLLTDHESIIGTWLAMKRGCTPILAVFDGETQSEELINVAKASLLPYALGKLDVVVIPITKLIQRTESSSLQRCLQYMAANDIADIEGAYGIVTSERPNSLSSDELVKLGMYGDTVHFPILYPLVGLSEEVLNSLSKRIGGEILRIGEKTEMQSTRSEETKHRTHCDEGSSLKDYREKIREMVMDCVEKRRAWNEVGD